MLKKLFSMMLACLLTQLVFAQPASAAGAKAEKEARFAEKVRAGILKLGTGPEARVEVKLRDKQKLVGYVSEASAEFFTVVDASGHATTVVYPQVKQAKGNNLADGIKIAIGVAAVIGIITLVVALALPKS